MTADRVVEVFSAADVFEANRLCALLEEEGIRARVVGAVLGNAAGWLPFAETCPRVWVGQQDESRARQLIDAWGTRACADETASNGIPDDESDFEEERQILEEQHEAKAEDVSTGNQPVTPVGKILTIVGAGCILFGIAYAMRCWSLAGRFTGTADAVMTGWAPGYALLEPTPGARELPVVPRHIMGRYVITHEFQYNYVVDGESYRVYRKNPYKPSDRLTIHYDPRHPVEHIVGSPAPPWLPLVLGIAIGSFLMFVGCAFR